MATESRNQTPITERTVVERPVVERPVAMRGGRPGIGYLLAALATGVAGGLVGGRLSGNNTLVSAESRDPAPIAAPAPSTSSGAPTGTTGPASGMDRTNAPLSKEAAAPLAATGDSIVEMVERVGPAVVAIDTLSSVNAPGDFPFTSGQSVRQGQGSGFIIDGVKRLAVTNNHVVENASRIRVNLPDGRSLTASVVGTDPIGDIALIKLDGSGNLPQVALADSDKLRIGQVAVAIGNPLGFRNTVTEGVLSAIGRQLPEGHVEGIPLEDLLQTDAAINPGNSGGPLLDASGRVVGMNTAIIPRAQGLGFAVASNTIRRVVDQIQQSGRVIRPWVGLSMTELNQEVARQLRLNTSKQTGVVVMGARPGDPASRAGLQRGDIVTSVNGTAIRDGSEFRRAISALKPGATVSVEGERDGSPRTWEIRLGEMPNLERLES